MIKFLRKPITLIIDNQIFTKRIEENTIFTPPPLKNKNSKNDGYIGMYVGEQIYTDKD